MQARIGEHNPFRMIVGYLPVIVLALFMLAPFYWMVIGAFKSLPELSRVPPTFTIENPTLNNFYDPEATRARSAEHAFGLFQRYQETPGGFMRFFGNSLFVSGVITVLSLLIASMAAYVIAKHRFPGRQFFFILFVASMMIPWQVTLITGFLTVKEFGWLNTYWALIIPALPRAFALFFLRQYMLSLPDELMEAARIDGASELRIWWQVVLPLITPALVSMGLFIFLGEWNNLVWPLVIIQTADMRTLPVVMTTMVDPFAAVTEQGVVMAASLLVSLPTLFLFIIFQRQFVRGIALSGVKG